MPPQRTASRQCGQGSAAHQVHLNGVVGRAPARRCLCRDDTRVAQRAEVDAKLIMVVPAQQLLVHLGHAVHGLRLAHRVVRGVVLGCRRAKHSNCAWRKDLHTAEGVHARPDTRAAADLALHA